MRARCYTQGRQSFGGFGCMSSRIGGGLACQGGGGAGGFQRCPGRFSCGLGAGALDRQQFRVGLTNQIGDIAEAIGLPSLPLEGPKLLVQLGARVVGAG